jgi:2-amino-4-hydroxy-6-hydroxymethyldihydropteridine diphosphokinase
MARVRAYVGLGANVGDAASTLAQAIGSLSARRGTRLRGVSRLYATTPVGVTDQPEFRNAVVALDVHGDGDVPTRALELLVELKALERDLGRRARRRWGPRELDLDLLLFGRSRVVVERPPEGRSIDPVRAASPGGRSLEIPHPMASERLFVLAPLADLSPGLVPPGWGETVERARRRRLAVEGAGAARPVATWDPAARGWRAIPGRSPGDDPTVPGVAIEDPRRT